MNSKTAQLPFKGRKKKDIINNLKEYASNDPQYKDLKTWSLVYYLGEEHTKFLQEAYGMFLSANGLNPMAFQSLKKLENDVIAITAQLLNGSDETCGVMTSGGTESCLLAVKTYRDLARAKRPWIRRPNMVIPVTAHVAWEKAAEYFNVKARRAPLDKDYRLDMKAMKRMVNRNTVMLLGSAPEYPHGLIDPIEELSALAQKKNIPLHVDACVGGYFLPFVEKIGRELPPWDFRVPGVTSISADTHKYGFAAKGASTILYRNTDYMKHQFFVMEDWPGGVFASPALLGTRPGGAYAAAWAALQAIGEEGYLDIARRTMKTTDALLAGIRKIPELEIIGEPKTSLFGYMSNHKNVNIFAVGDQMDKKGWHIDRLQRPDGLHAMVTPLHEASVKEYLKDLKASVKEVKAHPELAEQGGAATYGMISHIPLRGMVRKQVLNMFIDLYGPGGKMIDLANASADINGEDEGPQDLATRFGLWFLKMKRRFG